jgi:hypothetical protein
MIAEPAGNTVPIDASEFRRRMADLQKFLPEGLGSIPEESLRRENLYADEGELRK